MDALGGHSGPSHEPSWISTSSCSQRSRNAAPGTFFFGQSPYREHPRVAILKRCIFNKELRMAVVSSYFRASNPQNFKYLQTFFLALYALESDSFLEPPFGQRSDSSRRKVKQRDDVRVARAHVRCCQLRFFLFHKLLSAGCKTRLIRSQSCGADGAANSDETPDVSSYAPPSSLHLDSPTELRLCWLCFQRGLFGSAIGVDSTEHSLPQNGGLQERRREVI